LQTAGEIAQEVGAAEAVAIDLDKFRLGLGDDVAVAAVIMLAPEAGINGLSYAQDLGVPYLNINAALTEIGPELAMFAHYASAAPVVLASHWMAGAATFLALNSAKGFDRVQSIRLGAIVDEKDPVGPSAIEDMERVHGFAPAALVFERVDGAYGCPATPQRASSNQSMVARSTPRHFPRSIPRVFILPLGHRISASTL
jgi:hypothetical protein